MSPQLARGEPAAALLSACKLRFKPLKPLYLRRVVEVTVLPPHFPSDLEKADSALFAANVRRKMAEALAVPEQVGPAAHPLIAPLI